MPPDDDSAYRPADLRYGLSGRSGRDDLEEEAISDIFDTNEIFRRVVTTADREFGRSARLLFFSGLAAGLSMSLSFLGKAVLDGALPAGHTRLVPNLLYPLGFIFIVLGRYQLFTENTLTPVTLVLTRRASIPRLLRIWGMVLFANVLGTGLAALFLARTGVFGGAASGAALGIGQHMYEMPWSTLFSKGILAGWLIAGMVWLNHAVRSGVARLLLIFVLTYTIGAADLAHCIVGSSEVLYLVFSGEASLLGYLWGFLAPATLGNTVGGVLLVALLNYAQTESEALPDRKPLSWRDWLLGTHAGEPAA